MPPLADPFPVEVEVPNRFGERVWEGSKLEGSSRQRAYARHPLAWSTSEPSSNTTGRATCANSRHVIERAVILTDGRRLRLDQALTLARPRPAHDASGPVPGSPSPLLTDAETRRLERENIQQAIARAGGKIYGRRGAAGLLGLKPKTRPNRRTAVSRRLRHPTPP